MQGMLLIIPGMLLTGWASSQKMLYLGLAFYAFGECIAPKLLCTQAAVHPVALVCMLR